MSEKLRDLRKFRNLLINHRMQGQIAMICLGAYVLGCVSMGVAAFALYSRITQYLAVNDPTLQLKVVNYFLTGGLPLVMSICLGLGLISVVPYALFMSHRTAGPVIALRRYIQALQKGDYKAELHLRDKDDLQELAQDLTALAQSLEAREQPRLKLVKSEEKSAA